MNAINKTQLNKFESHIQKFKKYIDVNHQNIKADDNKRHTMALSMSILAEYCRVDPATAYASITEGGDDNKIDALYFSDDEDDLTNLVVVQSKYKNICGDTSTFTADEIQLVIKSCFKILKGENFQAANEKLTKKLNDYRELLRNNGNPAISLRLFFATNGLIHAGHKKLDEVVEAEKLGISISFIDATFYGNTPVLRNGELEINLKDDSDKTDSIFNLNSNLFAGKIVSCSLEKLMSFYKESGERQLLNSNVRYLIPNSRINKQIVESFIQNPEQFCYMNNGVTIICSSYSIKSTCLEIQKLVLEMPNIINGGQTVASIYQLYENNQSDYADQFKKAKILIRIYSVPNEYVLKIAKATNSQNPIDVVDLHSNDLPQQKAKEYLEKYGIGLLLKGGEDDLYYDDTITNESILQIYASLYEEDPAKAKSSKARTFEKYYPKVFNDQIDESVFKKLYRCYQISNFISSQPIDDEGFLKNAMYALIYLMKKFENLILNENIPQDQITTCFQRAFDKAVPVVKSIVNKKQEELGNKFSLNNLFKGSEIKDLIDINFDNIAPAT